MENILPLIPNWIMITIGLVLLGIEVITGTFVILFFGIAFVAVGLVGMGMAFSSGETQLLVTMIIGFLLTLGLRKKLQNMMTKSADLELETMVTGDVGKIVKHQDEFRVDYKGTTWAIQKSDEFDIEEGDQVLVTDIQNNIAHISQK